MNASPQANRKRWNSNDSRRGGDIDIHLEASLPIDLKITGTLARINLALQIRWEGHGVDEKGYLTSPPPSRGRAGERGSMPTPTSSRAPMPNSNLTNQTDVEAFFARHPGAEDGLDAQCPGLAIK